MNRHLRPFLIILLSSTTVFSQSKQAALEKYFSKLSKNQRFNGNVLVAENGKIIYQKSFGYANFENKRLNTKTSTFPIASITKTFTATAILQLQEKGKLKVTDFVTKYLPKFPYSKITIRHLLSHTSGLRPYDDFFDSLRLAHPDTVFTNADMLPRYAALKLPLLSQPGEIFHYDNINFIFLALIIEKVSGVSFKEFITNNIFKPADMQNTFIPKFSFYHWTLQERKGMSVLYLYPHFYSDNLEKPDTISYITKYWQAYNINGEGEIISTTNDLLKYDQALYNGKLLNQESLNEAFTPVKLNNGQDNSFRSGLGWLVDADGAFGKTVRYMGGVLGLRSHLHRNITKQQTIIIIDNTQNEVDNVAADALRILNGQNVKPLGKSIAKEYGILLVSKGTKVANSTLEKLKKDTVNNSLNENEFNSLGYEFMANNKIHEALETFILNTKLFPTSWNAYDSYGEALLQNGQKEEAIKMYKKSIELNPDNEGGKKILEEILK